MENKMNKKKQQLKVLCLHGFKTSGQILPKLVERWPQPLLEKLDLVFMDAPYPARGKSDVDGIFETPFYEWFQSDQEFKEYYNFEECMSKIQEFMLNHGPFDGILGFSQSAADKRKQVEGSTSEAADVPHKAPRRQAEVPLIFVGGWNERHALLQFDNIVQPHRNTYLNKLYKLKNHPVCPPRYLNQVSAQFFGVQADLRQWFSMGMRVGNRIVNCEIWNRVFLNREPVHRELCLEFYSTLRLKKELSKVKDIFEERIIRFYCGGAQRKLFIVEYGFYVGMYSREELNNPDWRNVSRQGLYVKADLGYGESIAQYWGRISGGETWPACGYGSVSKIKSGRLRLLHRILVTFYIQRSAHWDKAYQLDLWLIKFFSEGSPRKFALPPMVLLDRMCNHSDAELVLGHYITRIYKRMGVFELDDCQTYLSPAVYQVDLNTKELIRAKIVKKKQGSTPERLMDDEGVVESPPPDVEEEDVDMEEATQEPPRRRGCNIPVPGSFDFTELGASIQSMIEGQQRLQQDMTWVGSQQAYTNYTLDYYQPMWNAQYHGEPFVPPVPIPDFRPPQVHFPSYRHIDPGTRSPRSHDLGGSPQSPVQFGTYQGVGGYDFGGSFSMAPGFITGTSSEFAGGDAGNAGSGQEEERNWVTDLFGPPVDLMAIMDNQNEKIDRRRFPSVSN